VWWYTIKFRGDSSHRDGLVGAQQTAEFPTVRTPFTANCREIDARDCYIDTSWSYCQRSLPDLRELPL
jgi:hypothetical protein